MRSINRLLENSKRSDVRGNNVYSMGRYAVTDADYEMPTVEKWLSPRPGLFGAAAIGYEIDVADLILPQVAVSGHALSFFAVRHRWTPAYCDTYYRSEPIGEYQKTGTVAMRERKCFTAEDTFVACMELINDDTDPIALDVSLSVPFPKIGEGLYRVTAEVVVAGLKSKPSVRGFAAARTSLGETAHVVLPAQGRAIVTYGLAFSKSDGEAAVARLDAALKSADPYRDAEERFDRWMQENAPRLETDDIDLLKVYYYRFFLIKCAIHTPSEVLDGAVFEETAVYESPFGRWFGCPIGLPIPLQLEEMRWMRSDFASAGHIAAWCASLGNSQNYIQYTPMAILHLYRTRGEIGLLRAVYPACRSFTLKKSGEKTPERLPITNGSWQTGAEYQPSFYQYTEPAWDWRQDCEGIRLGLAERPRSLYRADECAMHVANLVACREMATILDISDDVAYFDRAATCAAEELVALLKSSDSTCFLDRDVEADALCDEAQNYAGFLPLLFDLVGKTHDDVLSSLSDDRFFGGFGPTTVAKKCPMYWFDSHIVCGGGATKPDPHHYFSSWNGAIWPFASSLVLDALGGVAVRNPAYRALFLRFFAEYTDLHFLGGDRSLPCMVEHYRVSDGYPLSPYTEYFHSKWLDLFLSYRCGIRVDDRGLTFEPMTDEDFVLEGVLLNGIFYRFEQRGGRRSVHAMPFSAEGQK